MPLTDAEFAALASDANKWIDGDIEWVTDEDHSPSVEFRVDVQSTAGYPLVIKGSYNGLAEKLTYAVIYRGVGRVYALDLGSDHRNPDGGLVGEKHKHRYSEAHRDKHAYVPADITEPATDPVAVWKQFCIEACIEHRGRMNTPPPCQNEMFV